jgi:hypothetical protein
MKKNDTPLASKLSAANPVAVAFVALAGLIAVSSASVEPPIDQAGVTVSEGRASWETAEKAAGHRIDSTVPGLPGNMVSTEHVSVGDRDNLAVLKQIDRVPEGNTVEVYSGDQIYRYAVSRAMGIPPSAVKLLRSNTASTMDPHHPARTI